MMLVHVQKMYKTCYSSSFFFFSKNEEEAIPLGGKKYLGTTKGSTRLILVHVRITVVVFFFFQKMKRKLSPPEEKIFRDNKSKCWNDISTCTEDVQYI